MKAVAFSNNDIAVVAWTFGGRLQDCLGFAIYRTDVKAGTETCLPALATFPGQDATPARTTATDPVQKFFWKDVFARRGGSYRYRVVPMAGTPGSLAPMSTGALTTNVVQLTPAYGVLSAYFNRGMLATQATARALHDNADLASMKTELLRRIADPADQLRKDLAGDMIEAMTLLPKEAATRNGRVWCALYEFEDVEVIGALTALAGNASIILSNMPGTSDGAKTDDTYAPERHQAKDAGVDVIDRMMPSGHIGHNKFTVLDVDGPAAVQFGSTNVTDRALCAQSNNTVIARSPKLASAYMDYWTLLKADTAAASGKGKQASALRGADAGGPVSVPLEDGSATVDLWFSPNTAAARTKTRGADEAVPPDLKEVFDLIAGAKQAILFVAFEPGKPSIIGAVAAAQLANPNLFVRGTVTMEGAAADFAVAIKGDAPGDPAGTAAAGGSALPVDYRVIPAEGVNDPVGVWEKELNKAGFAVTHSKFVVIDPFTNGCVVVTGSHNLGYQASYNNDENMAIIKGHRAVAEAYAANALDIYDHYAWRWWLSKDPAKAWTSLKADDSWQDSYFDADSRPVSPELGFWLAASPSADAMPAPSTAPQSDRIQPALREVVSRSAGRARPPVPPTQGSRPLRVKTVAHATGKSRKPERDPTASGEWMTGKPPPRAIRHEPSSERRIMPMNSVSRDNRRSRWFLSLAIAISMLAQTRLASAWGDEGHEVVALIARAYLKPDVAARVSAMLANDAGNTLTAHDMASEATWADKFRDRDIDGAKLKTREWHFVDIELNDGDLGKACFGHPQVEGATPAYPGVAQDCVVDKIEGFRRELADPATPPDERLMALKFLLHFVGDVHQPLHAADDADHGGNGKQISSTDFGTGTLHAFWDVETVRRLGPDAPSIAAGLASHVTPDQAASWSIDTSAAWAMEAYAIARADAYGMLPEEQAHTPFVLTEAYERQATLDAALQLSRAGVRLAAVLNGALGTAP